MSSGRAGMSRFRGVLAAIAATTATLVFVPAVSADGTYSVLSCSDPTGALNGAAGWVLAPPVSGAGQALNSCPSGGTLSAALIGPQPGGDSSASWQFAAPPSTRIVRLTAARTTTGVVAGTTPNDVQYVLATDTGTLETCAVSDTSSCVGNLTGVIDKQGLNAGTVGFRVLCTNVGSVCLRPLRVDFKSIAVGLSDPSPPAVSNTKVLDDGDVSGVLSVTSDASDTGGGVYRALVKVDGQLFRTQSLAPAPCVDAVPADADAFQFTQPVPCPLSVLGAAVRVDYRDLASGPHAVEVDVEDAAGNATPIYGPVAFPKLNVEVQANNQQSIDAIVHGHLKMWFVKTHLHRFTSHFGTRTVARGLLTDSAGKGIEGARIDVFHILRNGKRRLLKTGLKSRAGGALTLILPMNLDTRKIEFDFRALRPGPTTSLQTLNLHVLRRGKLYFQPLR